ncbi:MAG: APC family permease [Turneriella sp.]|nr:APC family permease [Turneriella sp.]
MYQYEIQIYAACAFNTESPDYPMKPKTNLKRLSEMRATAICGNDISSSCLYVSGLAILQAGKYAWLALLIVGAVLYLFRKIYGEVVGALPLNGGAYNALLNTTSKSMASLAATLTMLSYMATAVISAGEAIHYLNSILHLSPFFVLILTICLLAIFMFITMIGIGESSMAALGIFLFHLGSLVLLTLVCLGYILFNGFDVISMNFAAEPTGGFTKALFFGFCAAMLGISGFESSANFVEEQREGVFPKTLRNMWVLVTIFNPLIALLVLSLIPIGQVGDHKEALLAYLGQKSGGPWLGYLISVDAVLVLSGAVLTSFVGVGGLVERISLDRIMPQFFLARNNRGSAYRIYLGFFILCVSILLITQGDIETLAGVYTISFLLVMALFGIGNILLKVRRERLPRPERAGWLSVYLAIGAVTAAIVGNVVLHPAYFGVFLEYFIPTIAFITIMLNRVVVLRWLLRSMSSVFVALRRFVLQQNDILARLIDRINSQEFVYFTKDDDVATLNKVMRYISENEHTRKLRIVTVVEGRKRIDPQLRRDIEVLDREYPEIAINYITYKGIFGPELIQQLSDEWKIPVNFMFIGSPGDKFPFSVEELGGVRLII